MTAPPGPGILVVAVDLTSVVAQPGIVGSAALRRAERFRFERDRDLFLRRRTALARACGSVGAGAPVWLCPECGSRDHGRPSAPGAALSTSSHGAVAVMAFGRPGTALGVDVTGANPDAPTVAAIRSVAMSGGSGPDADPAELWARREAMGKALGIGFGADDDAVLAHRAVGRSGPWTFTRMPVGPDLVSVVCAETSAPVEMRRHL